MLIISNNNLEAGIIEPKIIWLDNWIDRKIEECHK